jgi:hypothetical protein
MRRLALTVSTLIVACGPGIREDDALVTGLYSIDDADVEPRSACSVIVVVPGDRSYGVVTDGPTLSVAMPPLFGEQELAREFAETGSGGWAEAHAAPLFQGCTGDSGDGLELLPLDGTTSVTEFDDTGFDLVRYDRLRWMQCESAEVVSEGTCEFDTVLRYRLQETCEEPCYLIGRNTEEEGRTARPCIPEP